jgi:hypothetical protein
MATHAEVQAAYRWARHEVRLGQTRRHAQALADEIDRLNELLSRHDQAPSPGDDVAALAAAALTAMTEGKSCVGQNLGNMKKVIQLGAVMAELLAETLKRGFFGTASVELSVQDGTIQYIRRRVEEIVTDAPPVRMPPRRAPGDVPGDMPATGIDAEAGVQETAHEQGAKP